MTWPVGSTPTLGSPSTSAALISIGALAAMASWLQVRSWFLRMARPSSTSSLSGVPVSLRKARALRSAFGNRVIGDAFSRASTVSVRITRCGAPSSAVVTTVSNTVADV